jgi:hypothetical protein
MRASDAAAGTAGDTVGGVRTVRRRALLAVLAAVAVAALAAAVLLSAPWQRDPSLGQAAVRRLDAERELLRERLGGLAALVIDDDPELRACADRDPVPVPTATDPVEQVIAQVEAVRQLALDDRPEIQLLDDAEMTERVADAFAGRAEEERTDLDARMLAALGAIAPGTDLGRLRGEVFARQVSGYHLGGQGVIAVRNQPPPALSPLERVVLAHELEHALSLAHLGRPADHRDADETEDAALASAAVVEGSAVALMLQYAAGALSPADQAALRDELVARAGEEQLAGYSPYLRAELRFPYVTGLRYICQRWLAGGWEAVADAYRDPPPSTAAVLFPERHGEQPRQPAPLFAPGAGWERARTSSFGAAELEWLLAAPGGDRLAAPADTRERVSAWDGGEVTVWTGEAGTVVGLALVDRGAGPSLCDTVRDWYAAAFPAASAAEVAGTGTTFTDIRQDAVLACPGDQVRLGIGPTTADAAAVTRQAA